MIHDLSPPIDERLAVWPGDTPPSREVLLDRTRGDSVTLSTLRATVHLGSHADAPSHYASDGLTIDQQPLRPYVGRCQLIQARMTQQRTIGIDDLSDPIAADRVLIACGVAVSPGEFATDFRGLDPRLIEMLGQAGVILVGVDTPSVDLFESKDLPAHQACREQGIAILEGLVLRGIPSGIYELIALPLRLVGFDASPVRAVLRSLS